MDLKFLPDVLVVGPGAEKGYYELGALEYLNEQGYLKKVKYCATCSIGSIISLLWIVGYSFKVAINQLKSLDTFDVLGEINIGNLIYNSGFFETKGLRKLLENMICAKIGYVPDLYSLYMSTGIEFSVIGTNLNRKNRMMVINYKRFPDMSCIDAVLISSSIPVLFSKIEYQGDVYIDGVFSNPYPVDVYNDPMLKILGIYIEDRVYIHKIENNIEYFNGIIHSFIDTLRDLKIRSVSGNKNCYHLEISVSSKVKSHLNPNLDDKEIMIAHGRNICKHFISLLALDKEVEVKYNLDEDIPFLVNKDDKVGINNENKVSEVDTDTNTNEVKVEEKDTDTSTNKVSEVGDKDTDTSANEMNLIVSTNDLTKISKK